MECQYAKCCYIECYNTACHYADCCGAHYTQNDMQLSIIFMYNLPITQLTQPAQASQPASCQGCHAHFCKSTI
jgi:hypothetical protein